MVLINYAIREISTKIVYYGPGLSGKTTNIQYIHSRIQPDNRGKLVSLATETDRTLFFDFFPIEFGTIGGFKVRFHFYTVPGQVFYNSTRKLVLKGADGVVFVADSQKDMVDSNIDSLQNLKENLSEIGIDLDDFPFVIQNNKRDRKDISRVEEMQKELNPNGVPYCESSALTGDGVMETMKIISKIVLKKITETREMGLKKVREKAPEEAAPKEPEAPEEAVLKEPEVHEKEAPKEPEEIAAPPPPPPVPPSVAKKIKEEAKLKEVAITPITLKIETAGETIQREITLPENLAKIDNLPFSLPIILEVPEDKDLSKLNLNLSASYLGKDGKEKGAAKPAKKKGLFGKMFKK
jgi:signal recognition particle receptor subunit beta